MIRVALRGLTGRKLRTALTAFAIVLGVAMVSGTYVLTDTINSAFDTIFSESYAGTDAAVTGKAPNISFEGTTATAPSIPASLLERIRALPSVAEAAGSVQDETATKILKPDGKAINTGGAPSFGLGIDPSIQTFNPLRLVKGTWPKAADEVVIDEGTADNQNYGVGETVRIATLKPVRPFKVVGIARYANLESLGTATFTVFTIPAAQELLDRPNQFDMIQAAAKQGVTPEELVEDIRPILPATAQVRSGVEQADEESSEVAEFTSFFQYFLLAFAAVALFVGAFVIFNTMSITVAQRTRELATLRTIGASRTQLRRAVLLEALAIGLAASLIGLGLGILLAIGLQNLFEALGFGLPTTDMVIATRTIVVALLVGVVVTVLAALVPAIRATRIPPILAVREGAELPKGRLSRFTPYIALVVIALSVLLLAQAMFTEDLDTGQRLLTIAGGVLLLFVGVAMISSKLVRPLAAVIGVPGEKLAGVTGFLARRNTLRNPGRTAATAAALMIGLALVTFVAVLANGMKESNRGAIEERRRLRRHLAGRVHAVRRGCRRRGRRGAGRGARDERPRGDRRGRGNRQVRHRHRARQDRVGLQLRLGGRLRRRSRAAQRVRRDRRQGLRRGSRSCDRLAVPAALDGRPRHESGGGGDLQPAALLPAARVGEHPDVEVRQAL